MTHYFDVALYFLHVDRSITVSILRLIEEKRCTKEKFKGSLHESGLTLHKVFSIDVRICNARNGLIIHYDKLHTTPINSL